MKFTIATVLAFAAMALAYPAAVDRDGWSLTAPKLRGTLAKIYPSARQAADECRCLAAGHVRRDRERGRL